MLTAALVLKAHAGWYRHLHDLGATLPGGATDWSIDVVVLPIGHFGTYRRSRQTGRWFAGSHRSHVSGYAG